MQMQVEVGIAPLLDPDSVSGYRIVRAIIIALVLLYFALYIRKSSEKMK